MRVRGAVMCYTSMGCSKGCVVCGSAQARVAPIEHPPDLWRLEGPPEAGSQPSPHTAFIVHALITQRRELSLSPGRRDRLGSCPAPVHVRRLPVTSGCQSSEARVTCLQASSVVCDRVPMALGFLVRFPTRGFVMSLGLHPSHPPDKACIGTHTSLLCVHENRWHSRTQKPS